ncbi:NGG1p interacting factor 3 family [Wallemia mellicola]|uniref:NGG1p interacting factor 3 family n=2 Tax=Wallemia mellicola TaxID=1708541 RepID=A0A4T0S074_9BASI|nr:NGG1p interacting factor 3 family [Wallemia mellicola]TIB92680.1 NGG1p interacting factor 3 family [Wallemia mellicola]TIC04176.1 NGG1p interacting factor 3 family [Wallemia mellicola]TIC44515.1 NGG1p interacting factor 3 family [Wallemia mellicola]TIC53654.1 NGG1p interacting factor 3 family [Wallemia mellicola]
MSISNAKIVSNAMQKIAPLELAERAWDNVGLLVEAPFEKPGNNDVVIVNDLTERVFNKVLADHPSTSVIVSYHPPIFRALKTITMDNSIQRTVLKCIANGISIYSPHTACDAVRGGVNDWMFSAITGHSTSQPIIPSNTTLANHQDAGMGRYGNFENAVSSSDIINRVKEQFKVDSLQFADGGKKSFNSVAVCAGSGSSILSKAPSVDLYVTGEMGHHDVLAAVAQGISVILLNHSNSERMYLQTSLKDALMNVMNLEREEAGIPAADYSVSACVADKDPLVSV